MNEILGFIKDNYEDFVDYLIERGRSLIEAEEYAQRLVEDMESQKHEAKEHE